MLLLVVCTYLPLNYIFTLLNPLVIRKIEGKIYPKISKWLKKMPARGGAGRNWTQIIFQRRFANTDD